jgi:hypothetical protein
LTVPASDIQDRGDLIVEKPEQLAFLHRKHPFPDGITEASSVLVRGCMHICVFDRFL